MPRSRQLFFKKNFNESFFRKDKYNHFLISFNKKALRFFRKDKKANFLLDNKEAKFVGWWL